jgi:undecaprenyl-diphosphatase
VPVFPARAETIARQIDRVGEGLIGPLRGNGAADRIFYTASALADHSILWHSIGGVRAVSGPRGRREAMRLSAALGVESIVVNAGVKSLFRRRRPVVDFVRPFGLRTPLTSSFPSGHASSAFLAATLLSEGSPALAPAWFGLATIVAASRVHVRIHHPTDVVAGAALGIALGLLVRRIAPLPPDPSAERVAG